MGYCCQTIDMAGNIKFGPDVEHIAQMGSAEQDRPGMIETDEEGMTEDEDWWTKHLQPSANNKDKMVAAIHDYVGTTEVAFRVDRHLMHDIPFQRPFSSPTLTRKSFSQTTQAFDPIFRHREANLPTFTFRMTQNQDPAWSLCVASTHLDLRAV